MKAKRLFIYLPLLFALIFCCMGCGSDDNNNVTAIYHVLDRNGKEVTMFNQGDPIQFELIIANTTNHTLKLSDLSDVAHGAFIVYGSEGHVYNPIVSSLYIWQSITIEPGKQFCRQMMWPWESMPLPSGKYYSICTFDFEELGKKSYTVNFEIR